MLLSFRISENAKIATGLLIFFICVPESSNDKCVYQAFKAHVNQYFEEYLIARGVNYFIKTVKYELQLV